MLFCYVSVLRKKSRQPQHRTHLLRCCFPDPQPLRKRTELSHPASGNQRFKIKKSRLSRAGPAHLLGPAYPLDLLSRYVRPADILPTLRKRAGLSHPASGNQRFKIKKPAATYFPAFAVSSAQRCLTSVFGMGTGIATSPWPPASITMPAPVGSGL